jgi:hypothetical protein
VPLERRRASAHTRSTLQMAGRTKVKPAFQTGRATTRPRILAAHGPPHGYLYAIVCFAPNAAYQSSVNGSMANCIQGKYEKLRPQKRGQVCWDALTPTVFSRSRKTGTLSPSRDCHESSVFGGRKEPRKSTCT